MSHESQCSLETRPQGHRSPWWLGVCRRPGDTCHGSLRSCARVTCCNEATVGVMRSVVVTQSCVSTARGKQTALARPPPADAHLSGVRTQVTVSHHQPSPAVMELAPRETPLPVLPPPLTVDRPEAPSHTPAPLPVLGSALHPTPPVLSPVQGLRGLTCLPLSYSRCGMSPKQRTVLKKQVVTSQVWPGQTAIERTVCDSQLLRGGDRARPTGSPRPGGRWQGGCRNVGQSLHCSPCGLGKQTVVGPGHRAAQRGLALAPRAS